MSAHTVYSNFIYFKVIGFHFNELHVHVYILHIPVFFFFLLLASSFEIYSIQNISYNNITSL